MARPLNHQDAASSLPLQENINTTNIEPIMRNRFRNFHLNNKEKKKAISEAKRKASDSSSDSCQLILSSHKYPNGDGSTGTKHNHNNNNKNININNNNESLLLADLRRFERLYKQESLRSNQLSNERELLESNLLSKEKIILSQSNQIKSTQSLLNNYKKNINDELAFFENDYKIWLEEKQNYESKIKALHKIIQKNGITITGRPESVYSMSSSQLLTLGGTAGTEDITTLLEENNRLRVQIQSLKSDVKSLSQKSLLELQFKDNLLEEINKLNEEKESFLHTIDQLKLELEEATKEFTQLNENISFHNNQSNMSIVIDSEEEDNILAHHSTNPTTDGAESELKFNNYADSSIEGPHGGALSSASETSHDAENAVATNLENELNIIEKNTELTNATLRNEYKNLEHQYKYQSNILIKLRFELNSTKQENQQLFFFINQLLKDNEYLQTKIDDIKKLPFNEFANGTRDQKDFETSIISLDNEDVNHELDEHINNVKNFLNSSPMNRTIFNVVEPSRDEIKDNDVNVNEQEQEHNLLEHGYTDERHYDDDNDVVAVGNGHENKILKFLNKNSVKDINKLINKNRKILMKKNVLRSSSLSTNSLNSNNSNEQKTTKSSNFRYFKKNNRISRIISNNVNSNFSINDSDGMRKTNNSKKKRNTVIGVYNPAETLKKDYNEDRDEPRKETHADEINGSFDAAEAADDSMLLNLKPLKIQKNSRKSAEFEETNNNEEARFADNDEEQHEEAEFDVGNVSLNASIDFKNLQAKPNFRKTAKATSSIAAEKIVEEETEEESTHSNHSPQKVGDIDSVKSEISLILENNGNSIIYHKSPTTIGNGESNENSPSAVGLNTENLLGETVLEESSFIADMDDVDHDAQSLFVNYYSHDGDEEQDENDDIDDADDDDGDDDDDDDDEEEESSEESDAETKHGNLGFVEGQDLFANFEKFQEFIAASSSNLPMGSAAATATAALKVKGNRSSSDFHNNIAKYLQSLEEKNLQDNPILRLLLMHPREQGQKLLTNDIDPGID